MLQLYIEQSTLRKGGSGACQYPLEARVIMHLCRMPSTSNFCESFCSSSCTLLVLESGRRFGVVMCLYSTLAAGKSI